MGVDPQAWKKLCAVERRIQEIRERRWMVVVWELDEGGKLDTHFETNYYPRDRYLSSMKALLDLMEDDQKKAEERENPPPLPDALPTEIEQARAEVEKGLVVAVKNDAEATDVVAEIPARSPLEQVMAEVGGEDLLEQVMAEVMPEVEAQIRRQVSLRVKEE